MSSEASTTPHVLFCWVQALIRSIRIGIASRQMNQARMAVQDGWMLTRSQGVKLAGDELCGWQGLSHWLGRHPLPATGR